MAMLQGSWAALFKQVPEVVKEHQCELCEKRFANQGGLQRHLNASHSQKESAVVRETQPSSLLHNYYESLSINSSVVETSECVVEVDEDLLPHDTSTEMMSEVEEAIPAKAKRKTTNSKKRKRWTTQEINAILKHYDINDLLGWQN
jgi:hypothetical protein